MSSGFQSKKKKTTRSLSSNPLVVLWGQLVNDVLVYKAFGRNLFCAINVPRWQRITLFILYCFMGDGLRVGKEVIV